MAKHSMPEMKEAGVNVTPLIDVVMVLIVFFMLVAKIGVSTGAENDISIPTSIKGLDIKDMGNALVLNVRRGPLEQPIVTALVPDKLTKTPIKQELKIVEPATGRKPLEESLKYLRFGPDMKEKTADDNPEFKVIIRGDEDMPYMFLEPVLISAANAKVKSVNFNTKKAEETTIVGGK
jgi:biopolymer transport protein ExbD